MPKPQTPLEIVNVASKYAIAGPLGMLVFNLIVWNQPMIFGAIFLIALAGLVFLITWLILKTHNSN